MSHRLSVHRSLRAASKARILEAEKSGNQFTGALANGRRTVFFAWWKGKKQEELERDERTEAKTGEKGTGKGRREKTGVASYNRIHFHPRIKYRIWLCRRAIFSVRKIHCCPLYQWPSSLSMINVEVQWNGNRIRLCFLHKFSVNCTLGE